MMALLSVLRYLFGSPGSAPARSEASAEAFENSEAMKIMRRLNPNGLIGLDADGAIVMLEDVVDPDGRIYRIEYRCTPDGKHAVAWCRYNPWGAVSDLHTTQGGLICLGPGAHMCEPAYSRFDLETAVARARYWAVATSVYHETGVFPEL